MYHVLTSVCLHTNWKVHAACDLSILVKGFLMVAGSHAYWKSDNILETVLDRDLVTTGH